VREYTAQKLKFGFFTQMIAESKLVKTDKASAAADGAKVLAGFGRRGLSKKGEF